MGRYLVFQVGCIECGVSSYPIKLCKDISEAESVKSSHPCTWETEGGDGYVEIIDLESFEEMTPEKTILKFCE